MMDERLLEMLVRALGGAQQPTPTIPIGVPPLSAPQAAQIARAPVWQGLIGKPVEAKPVVKEKPQLPFGVAPVGYKFPSTSHARKEHLPQNRKFP